MSARMVSSSLNAMHKRQKDKNQKQNQDRTKCSREADMGKCSIQER
jgi:hypothetical protein